MNTNFEIGVKVAPHHIDWGTLLWAAEYADSSPIYSDFWNFDHFYPIYGDTSGPCLESWVTLSAIAQATSRIRVGCMVNGVHYRHPAVVANMTSAIDIVSNGRFELGLGAGWNEEESNAYGIELGTLTERFDRFDEAVEIILSLTTSEITSFNGNYFTIAEARNNPKGPQKIIPICIGGTGEKRTLRTVAKFASHWNLPTFDEDVFKHKLGVLADHCSKEGRNINDIKISTHVFVTPETEPETVFEEIKKQINTGINQSIIYFQPPVSIDQIKRITEYLSTSFNQD
ncbi:MAG: TIGR03560 family F420-dependent LLM class oxidoreductase [Actinomycetota bacterium]|nr:TIGR03560 family F420-dependent LLM class oxidoreductase [Actinomycetota bacterium]MED5230639.1 TIGR03560 family F420-dependent LLM class oxidoreductase [Actinomycetota bacterium]